MSLKARGVVALVGMLALLSSPLVACVVDAAASGAPMMQCPAHEQDVRVAATVTTLDCCARAADFAAPLTRFKFEPVQKHSLLVAAFDHPASRSHVFGVGAARPPRQEGASIDTGPPDCVAFSALLI